MIIMYKIKYKYNKWACNRYGKPDEEFSNVPYIVRVFPLFSPSIYIRCYAQYEIFLPISIAVNEFSNVMNKAAKVFIENYNIKKEE